MSLGSLFEVINQLPSPWSDILRVIAAVVLLGIAFKTFIRTVHEGDKAMRACFGKIVRNRKTKQPIFLEPGFHLALPFAYNIVNENVLDRTFRFGPSQVKYSSYVVADASATVTFMVRDIYKRRFRAQQFDERVADACEASLRRILQWVPDGKIDDCPDLISMWFAMEVDWMLDELGIEFKALNITKFEFNGQFAMVEAIRGLGPEIARLVLGGFGESAKN